MEIKQRWQKLCADITELERCFPTKEKVRLLAVSKYATTEEIRKLYQLGQRDFGENYWQSAQRKMGHLKDLAICWHFIGHLQSNKCAEIAQHFSWVHSVAQLKHVALLAQPREVLLQRSHHVISPLQVCLQVNLSDDSEKYGVLPQDLPALARAVLRYPALHLRGLMVLPKPGAEQNFAALAVLRAQLADALGVSLPTLSMGMSADYRAAIQAGATIVRVGSLLFDKGTIKR